MLAMACRPSAQRYPGCRVCEVIRMTRLAPDIILAILDGRQPRQLNLHEMRGRQGEVPLERDEQRGLFGFATVGGSRAVK